MASPFGEIVEPLANRREGGRVTALTAGVVGALAAVIAGAGLEVRPPHAYGLCMACHGRDLLAWVLNATVRTHLPLAPASVVFPVLTTVGVWLGAFVAARRHGEFRWHCPDRPLTLFIHGVVVMNCALLAGGCAVRLVLRAAAGEPLGLVGFAALMAGIASGTWWLRWRAGR